MKILLSIVIIYISFTPKSLKEIIKMISLFYLTSFIFGGAALAMIYISNCGKILIQNGLIIGNYTVFTIFLGSLMAILVLIISMSRKGFMYLINFFLLFIGILFAMIWHFSNKTWPRKTAGYFLFFSAITLFLTGICHFMNGVLRRPVASWVVPSP